MISSVSQERIAPFDDRSSLIGRTHRAVRMLGRSPVGLIGAIIVLIVLSVAIFGPTISPYSPTAGDLKARFQPPGYVSARGIHLLGTDQVGRDILSRIIAGSRVSVIVGLVSVVISGVIGAIYGLLAGYFGGWVDAALMRFADAFLGIPYIVLVVAVSGVVGAGLGTLVLILGLTSWVSYSRVVRGDVLVVRELDYVMAARVIGVSKTQIMFRHIFPNVAASVIVLAALQVSSNILAESSLSFLGLGVQPPTVTWGLMLSDGRQHLGGAWWMSTFPGIAITVTVLGVVFLGDWVRDVLDPRMRGQEK